MHTRLFFVLMFLLAVPAVRAEDAEPEEKDPFTRAARTALIAYKNGTYDEARKAIEEASKLKPDDSKTLLLFGRIAIAQRDFEVAATKLHLGLERDQKNPTAHRYLGDLYFAQRNYVAARKAYQEFLRLSPGNADAFVLLAYCDIGSGNAPQAGTFLPKLIPYNDRHPGYSFLQAALARSTGKTAEAEHHLQNALVNFGVIGTAPYMREYVVLFDAPQPTVK